jgi:hypothetical protein
MAEDPGPTILPDDEEPGRLLFERELREDKPGLHPGTEHDVEDPDFTEEAAGD